MRSISDFEAINRHVLQGDAGLADVDVSGMNVITPGLMAAGILLSAALLVSDRVRGLLPNIGVRRQINVARGVRGTLVEIAAAASLQVEHRSLLLRRPRSRWLYGAIALVSGTLAVLATMWGFNAYWASELEGNAIFIVLGIVAGVLTATVAFASAVLAVRGEHIPRRLTQLVQTTIAGRIQPAPKDRVSRARLLVPTLSQGEQT